MNFTTNISQGDFIIKSLKNIIFSGSYEQLNNFVVKNSNYQFFLIKPRISDMDAAFNDFTDLLILALSDKVVSKKYKNVIALRKAIITNNLNSVAAIISSRWRNFLTWHNSYKALLTYFNIYSRYEESDALNILIEEENQDEYMVNNSNSYKLEEVSHVH